MRRRMTWPGWSVSTAMAVALLAAAGADAANRTWNGNTDANWNTAANWNEGALGSGNTPVFGAAGASGAALTNDMAALTSVAGLTFSDAAGSFTINGNAITLDGDVTVGTGVAIETLNLAMTLSGSRAFTIKSGTLVLGGTIGQSANAGLTKSGAGTLTLAAGNTFSGAMVVAGGSLTLDAGAGGSLAGNALTLGTSTGGRGTFVYDNTSAAEARSLSLGALALVGGQGDNTVRITRTALQPVALSFASLNNVSYPAIHFVTDGTPGVNGTDSKIVLAGHAAGRITENYVFFNGGDFAWYDSGGYVRAPAYDGTAAEGSTSTGGTSVAMATHQELTGSLTGQASATPTTLNVRGALEVTMAAGQTLSFSADRAGLLKTGGGTATIRGGFSMSVQGSQILCADAADDVLVVENGIRSPGSRLRFVKSGEGTVILKGTNDWGGGIGGSDPSIATAYINGGILEIGGSGVIRNSANKAALYIAGGARFRFSSTATQLVNRSCSGDGGIAVSAGVLNLTAANSHSGPTAIESGGTLRVPTGASCASSVLAVADGGTNRLDVVSAGGRWTCAGLTCGAGSPALLFNFLFSPSTTVAPLQVNGDVALAGAPRVSIQSSAAITAGVYPLVKYTGFLSGSLPAVPFALPAGMAASLVTNAANRSIDLNVTVGNIAVWGVGDGEWDIAATANWKDTSGTPITYTDTQAVMFDDTASGASPITVTLAATVSPASVTCDNANKAFVVAGAGITGGSLFKQGTGTLILTGGSVFSGGTIVSGGELIVSGGGSLANPAATVAVGLANDGNRMTVTGTGTVVTAEAGLLVGGASGADGNALAVEDGALLRSASAVIGANTGGTGGISNTVTVTGLGSIWTNAGTVTVGQGARYDALEVRGGGSVFITAGNLDVGPYSGNTAGSNNRVVVSGAGSRLVVSGSGNIQRGPANCLSVDDGGYASFSALTFGNAGNGQDNLTVAGGGTLRCTSFTFAQQCGNSTMVVSNGAAMRNSGAASLSTAGQTPGGNRYAVDGAGTVWSNAAVALNSRNSVLSIGNGGRFYSAAFSVGAGNAADSSNRVWVTEGGLLRAAGTITLGGSSIGNVLTLRGGIAQCEDLVPGAGRIDFIDDRAGQASVSTSGLYVRTAAKSAADLGALVDAGKITLGGAAVDQSFFSIAEITVGEYSGYTRVGLLPPLSGALLMVR